MSANGIPIPQWTSLTSSCARQLQKRAEVFIKQQKNQAASFSRRAGTAQLSGIVCAFDNDSLQQVQDGFNQSATETTPHL